MRSIGVISMKPRLCFHETTSVSTTSERRAEAPQRRVEGGIDERRRTRKNDLRARPLLAPGALAPHQIIR